MCVGILTGIVITGPRYIKSSDTTEYQLEKGILLLYDPITLLTNRIGVISYITPHLTPLTARSRGGP